jgi:hypothetical protein
LDSKGEAAFEKGDRYWRRWECFLKEWGVVGDPFLDSVPSPEERLLLARGYVSYHRSFDFNAQGEATTKRPKPMVSSTLRDAISSVASSFRKRGRHSPFHIQNGVHEAGSIHPRIRLMLRGYEKDDPPPRRQKAVTPVLLLDLVKYRGVLPFGHDIQLT